MRSRGRNESLERRGVRDFANTRSVALLFDLLRQRPSGNSSSTLETFGGRDPDQVSSWSIWRLSDKFTGEPGHTRWNQSFWHLIATSSARIGQVRILFARQHHWVVAQRKFLPRFRKARCSLYRDVHNVSRGTQTRKRVISSCRWPKIEKVVFRHMVGAMVRSGKRFMRICRGRGDVVTLTQARLEVVRSIGRNPPGLPSDTY